jgi:RimJ/RimL family protein N-acetyltransferase
MGHLMRCIGVAETALERSWEVRIGGELSDPALELARGRLPGVRFEAVARAATSQWIADVGRDWSPSVVHLDSYLPEADGVRPSPGFLLSNAQDRGFGSRPADLAIDGNLGAEQWFAESDRSRRALVGPGAAVVRREVRAQRGAPVTGHPRPRVLVVIGGTDPYGVTTRVASALSRLSTPLDLTIVCPGEQRADVRTALERSPHRAELREFIADLPAVARQHDLVITAAGTSVWDFACMGLPMAVICVADNQLAGYAAVIEGDLAVPLGVPPHDDLDARLALVEQVLGSPEALADYRERLLRTVDGLGSWRIVAAWEQLLELGPDLRPADDGVRARAVTMADARLLHEWRNDPTTRARSRNAAPIEFPAHLEWLTRALADSDRELLLIERGRDAIGTVRWDRLGGADVEVSITVAPGFRGQGLSEAVLRAAESALRVQRPTRLVATVHESNAASARLFARAGYLPDLPPDGSGFARFAKWVFPR